jgi:hypothetical protein
LQGNDKNDEHDAIDKYASLSPSGLSNFSTTLR